MTKNITVTLTGNESDIWVRAMVITGIAEDFDMLAEFAQSSVFDNVDVDTDRLFATMMMLLSYIAPDIRPYLESYIKDRLNRPELEADMD